MFKLFVNKIKANPPELNPKFNKSIVDIQESLKTINRNIEEIKKGNSKEKQIDWKFILTTAPLYFSLLAFFAILIGAFKTHSYLNSIGYPSIFSDVISNSSTLIAVVVSYSILIFTFFFYFYLPFFMFLFINHKKEALKNLGIELGIITLSYVFYITISAIIIIWGFLSYHRFNLDFNPLYLGLCVCVILPLLIFLCLKKTIDSFEFCETLKNLGIEWGIIKRSYVFYIIISAIIIIWGVLSYHRFNLDFNLLYLGLCVCYSAVIYFFMPKKTIDSFEFCIVVCFVFLLSYAYPRCYANIISSFEDRTNWQWAIFFSFPICNIIINLIGFRIFYLQQKKGEYSPKNDNISMGVICTSVAILFIVILSSATKFSDLSLYPTRFIEKTQDASWYLIHNGNTTSDKINGFDTKQINILKKEFSKSYQCTGIEGDVLYGYMAWNLGNTKVFCPVSVDFFNFTENEKKLLNHAEKDKKDISKEKSAILAKKSKKCLVIDGKYLQLVSGYYLTQPIKQ